MGKFQYKIKTIIVKWFVKNTTTQYMNKCIIIWEFIRYQHILRHLDSLSGELGEMESPTHLSESPDAHVNRKKRRYNKAWFGKRISSKERSVPYISSGEKKVISFGEEIEGPYQLSKFLHNLNNKKSVDWTKFGVISPKSIHKRWGPMMSWNPRPIKGNKRWFVAHNKRLSPFGLSNSNNNVKVGALGKFETTIPVLMKRKKAPRRSSLSYAR